MPHEEPSLQSWRTRKIIKENDLADVMWIDLYKNIKRSTQFPNNITTVKSLTYYSEPKNVDKERLDAEDKVVTMLKKRGFDISEQTDVVLGGEFRDVCIYEVAKKLLLLPQIKRLKIDKVASITTAYHYISEHGVKATDSNRHEDLISSLEDDFQVREDDEFVFVEKKPVTHKSTVITNNQG